MSILSKIFGKIFPSARAETPAAAPAATPAASDSTASDLAMANAARAGAAAAGAATAQQQEPVDVEAVLNDLASKNPEKLNWKTSIVDLLKLLNLDSSLSERKELAGELGYTGNTSDSATMNIWLHKQVMNKLAANGGKVPAELQG